MTHLTVSIAQSERKERLESVYRDYASMVYQTCLRIVGNEHDARDRTQEVFLVLYEQMDALRDPERVGGWLKRTAVNRSLNFIRKQNKLIYDENITDTHILEEPDFFQENFWQRWELIRQIKTLINELPDRYRVIFSLYAIEDYSHAEIADKLGIKVSTSRSHYARARKKILSQIKTQT